MISEQLYFQFRTHYVENLDDIIEVEKKYMQFLQKAISSVAQNIADDFNITMELFPFWKNYPPLQRGRAPRGTSIPWLEVGETVIGSHVIRAISRVNPKIRHPGLPSGSDIRFLTNDILAHLDIKISGPNDRADEVVPSPNQLSGAGESWENAGIINQEVVITGARSTMTFQPELPPLYIVNDVPVLCGAYFLKGVYVVEGQGKQPLDYLELICVPNGLLSFVGPNYNQNVTGLFIPGKDEKTKRKKRCRVRMEPLAKIADWRRERIWQRKPPLDD
ncbi:MAG: BglI family type II restriction endonuclease [Anaerolineae bacterium]|nr:BglI family type II restriction endonuclease [Anaerolineae bacterium]MDQ7036109.1 BglI family type II restriction endonuclease [Anaerolineae bacterium]